MPGSKRVHLLLQPRDRRLLSFVDSLGAIDREHATVLGPFSSISRANARLLALHRAGYLNRSFVGTIDGGRKAVYFPPGRRRGFADKRRSAESFIEHQLAVTDVYLAFSVQDGNRMSEAEWTTFSAPIVPGSRLIPDGLLILRPPADPTPLFIEADRGTESLRIFREKAAKYLEFAYGGHYQELCGGRPFRVIVVTEGERRCANLAQVVGQITPKLFWFTTRQSLKLHGPRGLIWLRPGVPRSPVALHVQQIKLVTPPA